MDLEVLENSSTHASAHEGKYGWKISKRPQQTWAGFWLENVSAMHELHMILRPTRRVPCHKIAFTWKRPCSNYVLPFHWFLLSQGTKISRTMISAKIESVQSYITAAHAFVTNVEIRIAGSTGPAFSLCVPHLPILSPTLPLLHTSDYPLRSHTLCYIFFTTYLPGFEPPTFGYYWLTSLSSYPLH